MSGNQVINIKAKVQGFPTKCGVYLMKNKEAKIIYIGKALNLKARTQSYFVNSKRLKNSFLIPRVHNI